MSLGSVGHDPIHRGPRRTVVATIERAGALIAYEAGGPVGADGATGTVVLLHNIFCDRSIFDHAVAVLRRRRYRTVAIDFRGHGESAAGGGPYRIDDLVGDVVAVLDREGIERATVVGVSLGATVAAELALAHPPRVEGLVLMGADGEPDGGLAAIRNTCFCALVGLIGMRSFVLGGVLRTIFGAWFRAEHPERFAGWRARLRVMSPRLARLSMRAWMGRRSLLTAAPRIAVPVRIVVGDDDVSCPLPCGEKVRRVLADADLITIAHAGHTMPAERPVETTAAILGFLTYLVERRRRLGHAGPA